MKSGKKLDLSLYLVLDANLCKTPEGMAETARKAVEGGCTVVQLRAPEWKKKKQLRAAFLLKELLKDTDVLFIVDDHIDIALLSGADGVHVGQEDIDPKYVRQLLGPDAVIGLSVGSIKELNTIGPDVDYIGIGPVFSTKTKVDAGAAVGLGLLEYISKEAGLPNVAIAASIKAMPQTAFVTEPTESQSFQQFAARKIRKLPQLPSRKPLTTRFRFRFFGRARGFGCGLSICPFHQPEEREQDHKPSTDKHKHHLRAGFS